MYRNWKDNTLQMTNLLDVKCRNSENIGHIWSRNTTYSEKNNMLSQAASQWPDIGSRNRPSQLPPHQAMLPTKTSLMQVQKLAAVFTMPSWLTFQIPDMSLHGETNYASWLPNLRTRRAGSHSHRYQPRRLEWQLSSRWSGQVYRAAQYRVCPQYRRDSNNKYNRLDTTTLTTWKLMHVDLTVNQNLNPMLILEPKIVTRC